jgi:hypothetical protein
MPADVGGAQDGLYTYDLTLEQGGPRVPDEDDLGGVEIENGDPPPQKGAARDGDMDNVQTATMAGRERMGPMCRVHVEYSAGEHVIVAIDAMGNNVAATAFGFTPNGTGDVTMAWDEGTLPPQNRTPVVRVVDAFGHGYATAGVDSARIYTAGATGTAANLNFEIELRG